MYVCNVCRRMGGDPSGKSCFVFVFALRLRAMRCDAVRCVACERRRRRRAVYQAFRTHEPRDCHEVRIATTIIVSCATPRVRMYVHEHCSFTMCLLMTGPHLVNKPWIPIRGNAQEGGVTKPWRSTSCPRPALALGSTSPRAPTQLRTHARTHARTNERNESDFPVGSTPPTSDIHTYIHTYICLLYTSPSPRDS